MFYHYEREYGPIILNVRARLRNLLTDHALVDGVLLVSSAHLPASLPPFHTSLPLSISLLISHPVQGCVSHPQGLLPHHLDTRMATSFGWHNLSTAGATWAHRRHQTRSTVTIVLLSPLVLSFLVSPPFPLSPPSIHGPTNDLSTSIKDPRS